MGTNKWIVTGAAGFIGVHVVNYISQHYPDDIVYCVDRCSAEIMRFNLGHAFSENSNILGVRTSYTHHTVIELAQEANRIVHLAATTHVDTSIDNPGDCLENNVTDWEKFLRLIHKQFTGRLVYVSTDEVYGDCFEKLAPNETAPTYCSNVYAATKSAAEQISLAYYQQYNLNLVITRGGNTFGAYQAPEKFIPRSLYRLSQGQPIELYGQGDARRSWLFAEDHARGIVDAAQHGEAGKIYNLPGGCHSSNRSLAVRLIRSWFPDVVNLVDINKCIQFVADRPGHDMDYRMCGKLAEQVLGFTCYSSRDYDAAFRATVAWYRHNSKWLEAMCRHGTNVDRQGLI